MNKTTKQIRVNGTEIHYVEAGDGVPLLLLHGGLMSTAPVWDAHPASYGPHLATLAARYRVIAPDTRGCGRTIDSGDGSISFRKLAEDVVALSAALGLERPAVCGFSDGGAIATFAAILAPNAFRAVVNDAGFDLLDPRSRTFPMARQIFGGAPDATKADPDAVVRFFSDKGPVMAAFVENLQADHEAQGGWKRTLAKSFERITKPSDVTVDDLAKVASPTLILTGDRDMACSAEEAVAAYRKLGKGELAIVPGLGHELTKTTTELTLDFLARHTR